MFKEDVTAQSDLATSTQDDAVRNIQGGEYFTLNPVEFKENWETLQPEIDRLKRDPTATPVLAEEIRKSPEHAAALIPDSEQFQAAEQLGTGLSGYLKPYVDSIGKTVSAHAGPVRELNDLTTERMRLGGKLPEAQDLRYRALMLESKENFGAPDMGSLMGNLPANIAGVATDAVLGITDNKAALGVLTAGAVGVAALSAPVTVPVVGAAAGLGLLGTMAYDSFTRMRNDFYNGLDEQRDATTGQPMDEMTKQLFATGIGAVSASLEQVGDLVTLNTIPGVSKILSPKNINSLMARSEVKAAVTGLGKVFERIASVKGAGAASRVATAFAANGGEEWAQEVTSVLGEEVAATYNKGEVEFTNGILTAWDKINNDPRTRERLGTSFIVGGVAGSAFSGAGNLIGAAIDGVGTRKPSPLADPPAPNSNIVEPSNPNKAAIDILHTDNAIKIAAEVTKKTKLYKIDPKMAMQTTTRLIERTTGIKQMFIQKENFDQLPEPQRLMIEENLDANQKEMLENNTPVGVKTHQFAPLLDKYPDAMEWFSLQPDTPWAGSARDYAAQMQARRETKDRIFGELGVMREESPTTRASKAALTSDADDTTIINTLKSKETADVYLERLDANEAAINQEAIEDRDLALAATDKLQEIGKMRERVQLIREQLPDDQGAQAILEQALNVPDPMPDVAGEAEFMTQTLFDDEVKAAFPEKFVETIENQEASNRLRMVEGVNEAAELEMNKVIDIQTRMANEATMDQAAREALENPNVAIVERFLNFDGVAPEGLKKSKGYPVLAIDPKSLDPDVAKYYNNDVENLKKRRVFKKGGAKLDDVARLLGRKPMELLDILARSQSKAEIVQEAYDRQVAANEREARLSVDINETAIVKTYNDRTNVIRQYMNWMKDEKWGTFKKAIRKVALTVPRSEEVRAKAMKAIGNTVISDLNVNQHKVAERKSHRIAVTAATNYDLTKAFQNFGRQMLNNEMARATQIATGKVNQVMRLAIRMEKASVQTTLKDAGPAYVKAYNEIMDTFNLRRLTRPKAEEFKAFKAWTNKMIKEGHGNFEFSQPMEIKEQLNDMTVNEVLAVGEKLRTILKTAQEANMLRLQDEPAVPLAAVARDVRAHAMAQVGYDRAKSIKPITDTVSKYLRKAAFLDSGMAVLKNTEFVIARFDGRKLGGMLNSKVIAPLYGIGKYTAGMKGKMKDMIAWNKQYEQIINQFGKKEWRQLRNTFVEPAEFQGATHLSGGRVSMGELVMMMLNYGNEGNKQRLSNFTWTEKDGNINGPVINADVVHAVAQRYLTHKHMRAVQAIWDSNESYKGRVKEMHKRVSGNDVDMVEAVPFAFTDATGETQVYPGGYHPLNYRNDQDVSRVIKSTDRTADALSSETKLFLKDQYYADDMTVNRHTQSRTGSDRPLNINMETIGSGIGMVIHDLNFREVIRDSMHIVTHPTIAEDIASVVGLADFRVVVNGIVNLAEPIEFREMNDAGANAFMDKVASNVRAQYAFGALAGNVTSVFKQALSLPYMQKRLGWTGPKYVLSVLGDLKNPLKWKEMMDAAIEINPQIEGYRAGIDDNQKDVVKKLAPRRDTILDFGKFGKYTDQKYTDAGHWSKEKFYGVFGTADNAMKVTYAIAAYRQFMNGSAPGHDYETVMNMSIEERSQAAKEYASSHNRTTGTIADPLSKSPIQMSAPMMTLFYNDARNFVNNVFYDVGDIKDKVKRREWRRASGSTVSFIMLMVAYRLLEDELRRGVSEAYNALTPDDWEKSTIADRTYLNDPTEFAKYAVAAPFVNPLGGVPMARDIVFAISGARNGKVTVQTPATIAATNIAQVVYTGTNFMDYWSGHADLTDTDKKALLNTFGYTGTNTPVNFLFKIVMPMFEKMNEMLENQTASADVYHEDVTDFKAEQAELPPEEQVPEEALKALEEIDFSVNPPEPEEASSHMPPNTFAIIRRIESGGDDFAINKESGAAGRYQFMPRTWKGLMEKYPEAGLTEEGRMTSPEQQEIAMKLNTDESIAAMLRNGIEPTVENIYAFHFLGISDGLDIYRAEPETKLKTALGRNGQAVIDQNNFSNNMRVRNFKAWVEKKVGRSRSKVEAPKEPDDLDGIDFLASN